MSQTAILKILINLYLLETVRGRHLIILGELGFHLVTVNRNKEGHVIQVPQKQDPSPVSVSVTASADSAATCASSSILRHFDLPYAYFQMAS